MRSGKWSEIDAQALCKAIRKCARELRKRLETAMLAPDELKSEQRSALTSEQQREIVQRVKALFLPSDGYAAICLDATMRYMRPLIEGPACYLGPVAERLDKHSGA
ncbi:hypothetical protein LGM65_11025 [Burkholderia anthina]|uniref:hypothetical protein n=1 Tax=Burkholderia anthina TaxID=179879 RepID=UPI001CF413A2|nr:hypothetical protein [Burkholderia anthina]MCA8091421.1 hypothetical protein [Burkholderia anthina]